MRQIGVNHPTNDFASVGGRAQLLYALEARGTRPKTRILVAGHGASRRVDGRHMRAQNEEEQRGHKPDDAICGEGSNKGPVRVSERRVCHQGSRAGLAGQARK